MEWNEETIARLRALWAEGHSTAEIGRRMGISKNAVVGKAHRLNLAARPSPIRRDPAGSAPRQIPPRRLVGPTLPPLSAMPAPEAAPPTPGRAEADAAAEPAPVPAAAPAAPPVRLVPPRPVRLAACCWPIGEPGTKSFRFCGEDALPNKPYCTAHAQLAYVKIRDRREDAA
jgi:GcrA cell cycle regulator